jgi:hypothetical protein
VIKLSYTGADVSILLAVCSTTLILGCSYFGLITFCNAADVFLSIAPYMLSETAILLGDVIPEGKNE